MRGNAYTAGGQSSIAPYVPPSRLGEDQLLKMDYYQIIDNAMDLIRNSPVARAIPGAMEDYVGGTGLTASGGNPLAIAIWDQWTSEPVDISGTKSFNQVFRDIIFNIGAQGDVLLTLPIDKRVGMDAIATRLELTSAARISTPNEYRNGKDPRGNIVKFGVAYRDGREVGYYVRSDSMGSKDFKYIEKYDSTSGRLNAILIRRPSGMGAEQTRGLPMITPVVTAIKDLDDLLVSAIQGSRNKALLSVFLETDSPSDVYGGLGAIDENGQLVTAKSDDGMASIIGELPDGAIMTAPKGTRANAINSSGDIDRDALILRAMRIVATGVGIPFEILYKDFSQTNFSSGKLAFDSFFRMSQFWTDELIKVFTEVNKVIQVEAYLKGFGLPELTRRDMRIDLIGSQNYVDADPGKNSKAESERIKNNLTTASRHLAKQGVQYISVLEDKAREYLQAQRVADEYGVPIDFILPQNEVTNLPLDEVDSEVTE